MRDKQSHTFYMSSETKDKLKDLSKQTRISMSELLEKAVVKLYTEMKENKTNGEWR